MMPEPRILVPPPLRKIMRIFSRAGFPVTVAFGLLVAGVLAPGITGCNQEISTEPAKTQTPPTQTVPAAPTPVRPLWQHPSRLRQRQRDHRYPRPTQEPTSPVPDGLEPAASFPVPPDRDFYLLAQALLPGTGKVDPVVRHNAPTLEVGHRETLKLVDLHAPLLYESDFELRLVTTNAYWFVEDGLNVSQEDLETSAAEFEDSVYPLVTGAFGTEWKPGVDGDPHLYIINADLRGVGGYYSAADEYPKAIRPVSNEHESIYINTAYLPVGSARYPEVLAHELHHAIHWNADRSEETWINEGLSELAVTIAGYREASVLAFRRAGPTSLTIWPAGDVGGAENYGAASLFMHYFSEHYGGIDDLRPLLAQQGDGIAGLEAYLGGVWVRGHICSHLSRLGRGQSS